jgi:hypothetical protein
MPQLVHQGLTRGPRDEGTDNIGISEVSQFVTLPREALDVISQGQVWFLSSVLEVLQIARAHVCALEISNKKFLKFGPTLDTSGL